MFQALSNGRYKSVWHHAVVNPDRPRMSIASFLCAMVLLLPDLGKAIKAAMGTPSCLRFRLVNHRC